MATPKKKSYEPNYIRRLARARTKRIEKRVGKPMIFTEEAMLQLLIDRKVPTMVQHCVLKVKEKVQGSPHEKFISAFNICGWVFQHYGYLRSSNTQMPITGKGVKRNRQHQREKVAGKKQADFNNLVRKLWGPNMAGLKKEQTKKEKGDKK